MNDTMIIILMFMIGVPIAFIVAIFYGTAMYRKTRRDCNEMRTQITSQQGWLEVASDGSHNAAFVNEMQREMLIYASGATHEISFQDILSCDVIANNITVQTASVSGAVAGGIIGGGVGAIIGSQGSAKSQNQGLSVRIIIKDLEDPVVTINLLEVKVDTSSTVYKERYNYANQLYAVISIIINRTKEELRSEELRNSRYIDPPCKELPSAQTYPPLRRRRSGYRQPSEAVETTQQRSVDDEYFIE